MGHQIAQFGKRGAGLILVLALAIPSSGLGQLMFYCLMTGNIGQACCCHHENEQGLLKAPSLQAASCCEVVSNDEQLAPTRLESQSGQLDAPQFAANLTSKPRIEADPLRTKAIIAIGPRGPPLINWPPLFIKNCTYLI